jgi:predicted Ser/Thr protein kinase
MTTTQTCPHCQAELPADAPAGLCPRCLLQEAAVSAPPADTAGDKAVFKAPSPEELAPLFPQLEIIELLGQGGMGAVYKARQTRLDRLVALKVVPPGVGQDPAFAERFTREARALARLNHPNIVGVHDFGEAGGWFFFVMEFVNGANLRQVLQTDALTPEAALRIVPQVCEALQYAHDEGVVHRDIKPENLLLDKKGRVKIADFGLAKLLNRPAGVPTLTGSQQLMGTWHYMAPEQIERPQSVDHRADIYALGVVFYELLTGELPLGRFVPPSQKVEVDVRLDEVVLRTLEKEPERRYQQASEVRTDVEAITNERRQLSALPGREPAALLPRAAAGYRDRFLRSPLTWAAIFCLAICGAGFAPWELLEPGQDRTRQVSWRLDPNATTTMSVYLEPTTIWGLAFGPGLAAVAGGALLFYGVVFTWRFRFSWKQLGFLLAGGGVAVLILAAAFAYSPPLPQARYWKVFGADASGEPQQLVIDTDFLGRVVSQHSNSVRVLPQWGVFGTIGLGFVLHLLGLGMMLGFLRSAPSSRGAADHLERPGPAATEPRTVPTTTVNLEAARHRVRAPAAGLLLGGLLTVLVGLSLVGWSGWLLARIATAPREKETRDEGMVKVTVTPKTEQLPSPALLWAVLLEQLAAAGLGGIVVLGALSLGKLESPRLVRTAGVVGLVPFSPAWLLSFPVGLWTLTIVRRREVASAFDQPGPAPSADGLDDPLRRWFGSAGGWGMILCLLGWAATFLPWATLNAFGFEELIPGCDRWYGILTGCAFGTAFVLLCVFDRFDLLPRGRAPVMLLAGLFGIAVPGWMLWEVTHPRVNYSSSGDGALEDLAKSFFEMFLSQIRVIPHVGPYAAIAIGGALFLLGCVHLRRLGRLRKARPNLAVAGVGLTSETGGSNYAPPAQDNGVGRNES